MLHLNIAMLRINIKKERRNERGKWSDSASEVAFSE